MLDARIVTIRIRPEKSDDKERFENHLTNMMAYGGVERAQGEYENLEDYVKDLLNLADKVSDDPVIEIIGADVLRKNIFEKVIKTSINCLPAR